MYSYSFKMQGIDIHNNIIVFSAGTRIVYKYYYEYESYEQKWKNSVLSEMHLFYSIVTILIARCVWVEECF